MCRLQINHKSTEKVTEPPVWYDKWKHIHAYRQTDRQTYEGTDRQADRQTDRLCTRLISMHMPCLACRSVDLLDSNRKCFFSRRCLVHCLETPCLLKMTSNFLRTLTWTCMRAKSEIRYVLMVLTQLLIHVSDKELHNSYSGNSVLVTELVVSMLWGAAKLRQFSQIWIANITIIIWAGLFKAWLR